MSSKMPAFVCDSGPLHDIPLQNTYCVLCRFPMCVGDRIAAVSGCWADAVYSAYTLGFIFPSRPSQFIYTQVYEEHGSYQSQLCRHPPCLECRQQTRDTFLYHVDCFHLIRKIVRPLTLREIWTIAIWTQALPRTPYHVSPARRSSLLDDPAAALDNIASSLHRMPREVCQTVIDQSRESHLWRQLSACHRVRALASLLDPYTAPVMLPFSSVGSWDRTGRIIKGESEPCHVRLRIDDLGIKSLERLRDNHSGDESKVQSGGSWYIVEDLAELGNSRIQFKGNFARLICPLGWKLWNVPNPRVAYSPWFEPDPVPRVVNSIRLKGLTGLTAFCSKGLPSWIHPHYDFQSAPVPQLDIDDPVRRPKHTPIFFPLAEGETIKDLWVRYTNDHPGVHHRALVVRTSSGRVRTLGGDGYYEADNSFKFLGSDSRGHLLLSVAQSPCLQYSLCPAPSAAEEPTELPRDLETRHTSPNSRQFCYVSVASLQNLRHLRLFYLEGRDADLPQICIGILLEYADGGIEALGQCHRLHGAVVPNPNALYYRYVPEGLVAQCSSPSTRVCVSDGYVWQIKIMEGEIKWWFGDHNEALIE